jgi:hypothetical protein
LFTAPPGTEEEHALDVPVAAEHALDELLRDGDGHARDVQAHGGLTVGHALVAGAAAAGASAAAAAGALLMLVAFALVIRAVAVQVRCEKAKIEPSFSLHRLKG